MSELSAGLAATSNEPVADSGASIDAVLDTAFDTSPEPAASSDPSDSTQPAQEPAAAIAQPPTGETPKASQGEPPRERWDTILANARTKAAEDALAKHKEHLEIVAEMQRDLPGTLFRLLEEGAIDPRFAEQLTAKAAALLNSRKQQAKADEMPAPDQGDDKYVWYSPEQQQKLDAWKARQIKSELLNEFKPLLEMKQQLDQSREVQKAQKEAASIAEERGASWKTMPFFEDHKEAILTRQQAIYTEAEAASKRGEGRFDPINTPWNALQQAYAEVVTAQALPKLQSQQTDSLVAQAARKRAASSSDPAASAPAQPRKPRTEDEALEQVYGA